MQRELWAISDIVAFLRAVAINVDTSTEYGQGFMRALVTVGVGIGVPAETIIPQAPPQLTVISGTARRVNGHER